MLHSSGVEHIVLPKVTQVVVSNSTAVAGHHYQRDLVIVTEEGIVTLTLIAENRETLAFAGE
jgi:hypothetical protein